MRGESRREGKERGGRIGSLYTHLVFGGVRWGVRGPWWRSNPSPSWVPRIASEKNAAVALSSWHDKY